MDAITRRQQIIDIITHASAPVSATALSTKLGASRQAIVGDVALLRARGHDITATSKGYIITPKPHDAALQYLGKITSRHTADDTKAELYEIIDLGAAVIDVTIEHDVYGNITGPLNIKTRADVDNFINRLESSQDRLLLELSGHGVHQHTIACRDKDHFENIVQALRAKYFLHEK